MTVPSTATPRSYSSGPPWTEETYRASRPPSAGWCAERRVAVGAAVLAGEVGLVVELLQQVEELPGAVLGEHDLAALDNPGWVEAVLGHRRGQVAGGDLWRGAGPGQPLQLPGQRRAGRGRPGQRVHRGRAHPVHAG